MNVLVITADGTAKGNGIYKDLARANRKSLPTNLVYPASADQPALMLPEYLTPEIAIQAIKKAASMK